MGRFLSVGEMVIDFIPGEERDSYIRKAGGAPANVAIAVARQECKSSFCGMMGDDDFGHFLLKTLKDNGVDACITDLTKEAVTTMAFVTLDEKGDRSFTFARKPGADMFLRKEHVSSEILAEATIVHAGSCSLSADTAAEATVYALHEAHRLGKIVSFDVNYRNLMWNDDVDAAKVAIMSVLPNVDLLKISDEESELFGGEESLVPLMDQMGITLIVETLGANGVRCYWNNEILELSAIATKAIDTCGAGDAFWGGFISTLMKAEINDTSMLTAELIMQAMKAGNISGWLCVQKKGAIESLPDAKSVDRYLKEFYQ